MHLVASDCPGHSGVAGAAPPGVLGAGNPGGTPPGVIGEGKPVGVPGAGAAPLGDLGAGNPRGTPTGVIGAVKAIGVPDIMRSCGVIGAVKTSGVTGIAYGVVGARDISWQSKGVPGAPLGRPAPERIAHGVMGARVNW